MSGPGQRLGLQESLDYFDLEERVVALGYCRELDVLRRVFFDQARATAIRGGEESRDESSDPVGVRDRVAGEDRIEELLKVLSLDLIEALLADENPVGMAVANDAIHGEASAALAKVVLPDGDSFADRLAKEQIREFDAWIQSQEADPIPRALLRLLTDSANRGERLADQAGIVAWWEPGRPPKETWDGPATLASILGLRIQLFFKVPGEEGYKVIDFDP